MRSTPRIPPDELNQVITKAAEEYLREVKRLRRAALRHFLTNQPAADGSPQLVGEQLEAYIDVMDALCEAGRYDPGTVNQLIDEMEWSPEGKLSSDQILLRIENQRASSAPQPSSTAILDQYRFEVTGKISTRCDNCRRGYRWTPQEFMRDRFMQRILIGDPATCSFCHSGHIKVSGVTAVRRDQVGH